MRIRYWSSDGCSSDLLCDDRLRHDQHVLEVAQRVLRDAQRIFQPELGARTLGHALDVAAGGKGAAGAGENDRPDRFVAREIEPDVLDFPMLLGADRVELVGLVHRHGADAVVVDRSEAHTSELQSLMRNSYAVFCLKQKHNSTDTS